MCTDSVTFDYPASSSTTPASPVACPIGDIGSIRSTFVPQEEHCMCLFESLDDATTREVNEKAQIPFTRIVEAVDLTP